MFDSTSRVRARRRPIAACLATALCLAAPAVAFATSPVTWTVNSCNETNAGSGTTGTLRYAAANAASSDIIDMTGLACSTISLSTGAVLLAQTDITLKGPGKAALSIEGNNDRVLRHTGNGTLTVDHLTIANGYHHPSFGLEADGGCISSSGSVFLKYAGVHSCRAQAVSALARGGGIYAANYVVALNSDITGNTASSSSTPNGDGGGGGIFTYNDTILGNSTLSDNSAPSGAGGGARVLGTVSISASTISGNTAIRGGGIYAQDNLASASNTFAIRNSTVSGNQALSLVGGAWTNAGTINIENSTIAFNTAGSATALSRHYAPGLSISDQGANIGNYLFKVVTLNSSVFSNNAYGSPATTPDDIGVASFVGNPPITNTTPTSGANNLAFATTIIGLPNTLTNGVCPLLGPLHDNGGPTKTHALMSSSPAIDTGNTASASIGIYDQRGLARVSGAKADIGAYEVQQNDVIFNNGHEGCSSG